jgi:hypothetical protein
LEASIRSPSCRTLDAWALGYNTAGRDFVGSESKDDNERNAARKQSMTASRDTESANALAFILSVIYSRGILARIERRPDSRSGNRWLPARHCDTKVGGNKMDSGLLDALIGVGGSVLGSVTAWALTRPSSVRNDAYDKVRGSIHEPHPNDSLGKTILCSGTVTGMDPGLSLWLAVEVGEKIWPKENRPVLDQDNHWSVTIFEDGRSKVIAIGLFVADAKASKWIGKWLDAGGKAGQYTEVTRIPGARRVARVDNIQIAL